MRGGGAMLGITLFALWKFWTADAALGVPGPGDPPLSDDPEWDLPWCTEDQLQLRKKSSECFFKFQSVTEGTGICPQNCCCDQEVTRANTTYTVAAVGSCVAKFVHIEVDTPVLLWMEPYSVLTTGSGRNCSKTTREICGHLGGGKGCRFVPTARASVSSSPLPEVVNSDADSSSTNRTRNIALATSATVFLLALVAIGVVYFIIFPWLRGNLADSVDDDSELRASEENSSTYGAEHIDDVDR